MTDNTTQIDLSARAMLARVTIKQGPQSKRDRPASDRTAEREHATNDSVAVLARLLPKHETQAVADAAGALRQTFYRRTLAWQDDGARVLPSAGYLEFSKEIDAAVTAFDDAADALAVRYPAIYAAAPDRMGKLWRPGLLPKSAEQFRRRYAARWKVEPLPSGADFRAEVPADAMLAWRAAIERDTRAAIEAAQADIYARLRDQLGTLAERLTQYGQPGHRFRESLLTGLADLAALAPSLNVTGDPELNHAAGMAAAVADMATVDRLRDDAGARDRMADAARELHRRLAAFCPAPEDSSAEPMQYAHAAE